MTGRVLYEGQFNFNWLIIKRLPTPLMIMASVTEIKQLEAKIKENVKAMNELPTIVQALQHSEKAIAQAAMQSMRRVLLFCLEKGDLKSKTRENDITNNANGKDLGAIDTFHRWIWNVYINFIKSMLQWLGDSEMDTNLRVGALRTLMEFISREGKIQETVPTFGNETFSQLIYELVTTKKLKGEVASVFEGEFIRAYMDVQYYMLKSLAHILENRNDQTDATVIANALKLLEMVRMPCDEKDITSFLVESKNWSVIEHDLVSSDESDEEKEEIANVGEKRKMTSDSSVKKTKKSKGLYSLKQHQHAFSLAWIAVLRHKLPQASYEKVLVQLPDDIMPHLVNPLLLADFLTDSYNIGGVTSLLALNSLFLLIQDYNFDSPDFYNKLYALLDDPTLYSAKQRDRFFGLLNLFLSSTHLPAYTVAAFAKRLSRSALTAEPGAILFIIPMVYNLILRHKECLQLIHRPGAFTAAEKAAKRRQELSSNSAVDAAAKKLSSETIDLVLKDGHDPFQNNELDPMKCNALQSSLWELYTMKHHYNADVALKARMFEEKLRHQFLNVEDSMEITYKSIFNKQLKRKEKAKVPLAFKPCHALFSKEEDETDSGEKDLFAKVFVL
ncbi:putative nucleolar complex protein [Plasmopara halstedii]